MAGTNHMKEHIPASAAEDKLTPSCVGTHCSPFLASEVTSGTHATRAYAGSFRRQVPPSTRGGCSGSCNGRPKDGGEKVMLDFQLEVHQS